MASASPAIYDDHSRRARRGPRGRQHRLPGGHRRQGQAAAPGDVPPDHSFRYDLRAGQALGPPVAGCSLHPHLLTDSVGFMTVRGFALSALAACCCSSCPPRRGGCDLRRSAYNTANGQVPFQMTVPACTDRVLVVGISTTQAGTVNGGRLRGAAADPPARGRRRRRPLGDLGAGRAERRDGEVVVQVSGGAPVIAGARRSRAWTSSTRSSRARRAPRTSANSASSSARRHPRRDVRDDRDRQRRQHREPRTSGSVDLVVADERWTNGCGVVRGGGATRSGNTGAEHGAERGIHWLWNFTNPQALNPYAQT